MAPVSVVHCLELVLRLRFLTSYGKVDFSVPKNLITWIPSLMVRVIHRCCLVFGGESQSWRNFVMNAKSSNVSQSQGRQSVQRTASSARLVFELTSPVMPLAC